MEIFQFILVPNNSSNHNSIFRTFKWALQNILMPGYMLVEGIHMTIYDSPSKREGTLITQISDLNESYCQMQLEMEEIKDRHAIDLDQYSEQLRKSHEELKALKQKLNSTHHTELLKQITLSYKRKLESRYLCEVLFFLDKMCKESAEKVRIYYKPLLKHSFMNIYYTFKIFHRSQHKTANNHVKKVLVIQVISQFITKSYRNWLLVFSKRVLVI